MAITDPGAVAFSNERVRPLADAFDQAYQAACAFLADWTYKGMGALIPDDTTDIMVDGSATDGRTPITGHDINRMLAVANKVKTQAEATNADGSVDLHDIAKVHVN